VSPVVFLFTLASPTFASVKEVWWDITRVNNINPDGLFKRRVVGINGDWPPPPIDVTTRDNLVVHAFNDLSEPATLHHHGVFFNYSTWFDGAEGVSQCGIPTGRLYDYVVPISSSDQWGTYWIHGHASGQYVDGLRSPLIIHPEKEVYSYDAEYTVIISDWYHQEHAVLIKEFLSPSNPEGVEPVPDSGLIYFAQNGKYLGPIPGKNPPSHPDVGFNEYATLPFEPGKTYRLRIINMGAFAAFFFWIDGHEMTIIEVDGTDVEKYPIKILPIAVAQRYSVLVTARDDADENWAIHANMDTALFDTVPCELNPNITASITYKPQAPIKDDGFVETYPPFDDTTLVPIVVEPMLRKTRTMDLEVSFGTVWDGTNRGMFNGIYYVQPDIPSDLQVFQLGINARNQSAYGNASFVISHGTVLELVIKNGDNGAHPFHLHGHKFQIVGRAEDYTSSDPTLNPPVVEGQKNPIRRDTVRVPAGGSVTLRFAADKPGTWMLHCHMEWHLFSGLALVFIEAPFAMQRQALTVQPPPKALAEQCYTRIPTLPASTSVAVDAPPSELSGLVTEPSLRGMLVVIGCLLIVVIGIRIVMRYARGSAPSDEELECDELSELATVTRGGRVSGRA